MQTQDYYQFMAGKIMNQKLFVQPLYIERALQHEQTPFGIILKLIELFVERIHSHYLIIALLIAKHKLVPIVLLEKVWLF
jgi:hypothetical protein